MKFAIIWVLLLTSYLSTNGQQKIVDTIAFKRDFEKLLKKYGLQSESYNLNVKSTNQSGGQTAFIINNNHSNSLPAVLIIDSFNFHAKIANDVVYKLHLLARNNSISNLKIDLYTSVVNEFNTLIFVESIKLHDGVVIPNDITLVSYFGIPDSLANNQTYIYIRGSYEDLGTSKQYNFDELHCYNPDHKKSTLVSGNGFRKEFISKLLNLADISQKRKKN